MIDQMKLIAKVQLTSSSAAKKSMIWRHKKSKAMLKNMENQRMLPLRTMKIAKAAANLLTADMANKVVLNQILQARQDFQMIAAAVECLVSKIHCSKLELSLNKLNFVILRNFK